MNNSTRFLFGTVFAGIMGLSALVPSVYAQDLGAPKDAPPIAQPDDKGGMRPDGEHRGPGQHGGGIAGLICSTDGATQLETRLTDLATQLKLTTDQQPLFDAYQTAALSAQTSFADTCATAQPAAGTEPVPPDALTMLKDRVTHETAELAALNAVLPSFEALYNSLTDTQKAALMPLVGPHHGGGRGPGGDDRGGDRAGRHDDRGSDDRGGEPGRGDKGRHG